MIVDKVLANLRFLRNLGRGDTGRERVEHRSFSKLRFTQFMKQVRKTL